MISHLSVDEFMYFLEDNAENETEKKALQTIKELKNIISHLEDKVELDESEFFDLKDMNENATRDRGIAETKLEKILEVIKGSKG